MQKTLTLSASRALVLGCLWLLTGLSALAAAPLITPAQLVTEWQRAKDYTKEYLDAMPEAGVAFKPSPDIRSFAEQWLHVANANYMFAASISGKANPNQGKNLEKMDEFKTKAALTKAVMDSYDFVISALQATTEAQMGEKIKLFDQEVTRDLGYAKAFEHQTHHRGQTTIYLRMKGVKPPQEKLF
jgi:uncharacterized damage-inducible protein DinB